MAELKPCPFCGTDNVVLESYKARKGYEAYVQCNGGCMANQHTITYDTLEEAEAKAVEMWNTRTPQKEGYGKSFWCIASNGGGWEHISVHRPNGKMPTWEEMCGIKDIFFEDEEAVVQYHPKKSEYVNIHESCLHLWRPATEIMPTPPKIFV